MKIWLRSEVNNIIYFSIEDGSFDLKTGGSARLEVFCRGNRFYLCKSLGWSSCMSDRSQDA